MNTSSPDDQGSPPPAQRKASLLQAIWIVLSGFVMIGRNRDYAPDAPKISPAHLVIVAVLGALLFVGSLVTLVSFVTR